MRRAKIVGTLGPASNTKEVITQLIDSGLDVVRVNMSHGTYESQGTLIDTVREASLIAGREVGILLDLQGPKIRVDKLKEPLNLKAGEKWFIGPNSTVSPPNNFIPTVYKDLVKDATDGCRILFDDGLLEARAISKTDSLLEIEIIVGGVLKSNKGINLPDCHVSAPSFTEKDKEDLMFGLSKKVDFVALSFVREANDVVEVKGVIHKLKSRVPVIAKIEKPEAVSNIEEIIKVSDAIMVARGDMGVEVGNHLVPSIQKKIISLCNRYGLPVITATQMLESMSENSRPTRAEASDVANAVWDGTDAVMLSGETAAGKYPVETVRMMSSIVEEAERQPKERPLLRHMDLKSMSASIQVAASLIAEKAKARMIISVTQSGNSCLKMSRFRPKSPVLGVTNSIGTVRRMTLFWGITPYLLESTNDSENIELTMLDVIIKKGMVKAGDKVVITRGDGQYFVRRSSNSIKIEIIPKSDKEKTNSTDDHIQEESFDKGTILLDTNICSSCQNCIQICPFGIWKLTDNEERATIINKDKVDQCTLDMTCVDACPTGAIEIFPHFS